MTEHTLTRRDRVGRFVAGPEPTFAAVAERFWSKVPCRPETGCWDWGASCDLSGYGQFRFRGTMKKAYRVAYILTHGDPPAGLWLRHTCDNPKCVRPDHLLVGTAADNSRDMVERGRHRHGVLRVVRWDDPAPTIIGHARAYQGFNVADPRPLADPPLILAADGTWHRPLTTLELAALQSLPVQLGGEWLVLDGRAQQTWREHIGNLVPPDTAEAIAATALGCLLTSDAGVIELSCDPVWVTPREVSA